MYSIIRPGIKKKHYYKITTANKTLIGNQLMQYVQDKLIEFYPIDEDVPQSLLVYKYKLHSHDIEGSSVIHYWADDLDGLQADLTLIVDTQGKLQDIYNFDTLLTKWYGSYVTRMMKKYPQGIDLMIEETTDLLKDKKRYLELFLGGYNMWRLFLQNWCAKDFENNEQYKLKLHHYFGDVDLDLVITSKTESYERKKLVQTIRNTAKLDDENFDKKMFGRLMKTLTNTYNVSSSLDVDMEEIYVFGEDGTLKKSDLFLQTSVSNWYSVSNAFQLVQLSAKEFENAIEEKVYKKEG